MVPLKPLEIPKERHLLLEIPFEPNLLLLHLKNRTFYLKDSNILISFNRFAIISLQHNNMTTMVIKIIFIERT